MSFMVTSGRGHPVLDDRRRRSVSVDRGTDAAARRGDEGGTWVVLDGILGPCACARWDRSRGVYLGLSRHLRVLSRHLRRSRRLDPPWFRA